MTKPIKYDFFGQLGDNHLETFATDAPEQYASELASMRGLDPDEVIWEQAEGTVEDFDPHLPPPMTQTQKVLSAENSNLVAENMQLRHELENQKGIAEFWYKMYSGRFDKKEMGK